MTDRLIIPNDRNSRSLRAGLSLVLGVASLALAGCGGKPIRSEAFVKSAPAEQAMVMPPPSGPGIVSIIERSYDNAIGQDIHLTTNATTPGQNMIKVQLLGTSPVTRYADNDLSASSITEGRVSSEMRQLLPRVRMTKSQYFVQNAYGPFGYAFGRGAGSDLCMYGWQQIRSRPQSMSPFANYGVIQIRARVCEANATEARLLALMYNYTVNASVDAKGWNPYGDDRGLDPSVGKTGAPIYPRAASSEPIVHTLPQRPATSYARAPVRQTRPAPVRRQPAVTTAPVAQPQYAPQQFMPQGPRVPSPTGAGIAPSTDRSTNSYGYSAPASAAYAPPVQSVTVPSPSCTMSTNGADVVCR